MPSGLDGIADNLDPTPLANNAIADPDGENLPASLATGLSGRWDLEAITTTNGVRTSPNTVNSSIPAYLGGTIEADNQGMVSKAVRMSAMNQSIKTDPSIIAGKTSFTISLWFRFEKDYLQNKPGSYNTVLVAYNDVLDATPQFLLHAYKAIGTLGTQKLIFSHYDNDLLAPDLVGEIPLSALLDDGNWQHLTLTKSSGIIKIYRNSQQLVSGNSPAGAWDSTANGYLCFGALAPSPSVNDINFCGSMDRIRTWSRAITQAEVTALHHQDIDRDGLWDVTESKTRYSDYQATVIYHPNPTSPTAPQPTQTGYARSPFLYSSGALDFDQDELNDLAEQSAATDLTKPDTDGDNLTDGFEIFNNFNPLNAYSLGASGPRDDLGDPDSDSLTTLTEYLNGSNPRNRNSDGDSKNDAAEIAQGSDPANAADSGAAPTDPPEAVPFHLYGDYTAWEATLKGKGPHDTRTRRFRMSAPNVAADQTLPLLRGNAYELSLRYIRTKPGESVPWYCWETTIGGKSTSAFPLANHWVVDNRSALLAPHTHSHGTNLIADKKVNLLPVEVVSDLNNDGQITAADNVLKDAALKAGATASEKEKGTEYILQDDVMSNGAWDNQDQNGNICFDWPQYGNLNRAPASGEMDDDAIAIEVKAPSFGVAWFTHEAIETLSFFREKECLNAIAIKLEQPFDLSTQLPERLWIKFRPTVSIVGTVKGKLTFHIGKSTSEEWGKIDLPFTLVPDFGCEKFFEAARNYIFERNTQVFIWDYKMPDRLNPSQIFRLCVMREEATTAKGYDAYANNKKGIGAVALAAGFNQPTVMINGNQCFFRAGYQEDSYYDLMFHMRFNIADGCHGRLIIAGATSGISSDNFDNTTKPARGSDLAGPDPIPLGTIAGNDGILGNADDILNPHAGSPGGKFFSQTGTTWNFAAGQATGAEAVGGLSTKYDSPLRSDKAHQMFGRVPCSEQGKGCVFTATQIYGVGQAPAFAAAAKRSGNQMLSPSADVLAQELLILDSGDGSLALQHIDPVGNLRKAYIGRKSATGVPYYVNDYVQFWATKPRP